MRYLVRFITKSAAGSVEHNDKIVDSPDITIGRATDQDLHLRDRRVRLQHARIMTKDGDVHITTKTLSGITVNGRSRRDVKLVAGDVIELGSNILRVIEPPDDVDFAITFELSDDASSKHFVANWSAPITGIGGWSKRRLSWSLVAAVLLVALVLPGLSLLHPSVASFMRGSILPDDSLWLAGQLHSAHSSLGGACENCHVDAFQRVPDSACLTCHTVDRHVDSSGSPVLGDSRCASCHLEHNDPPELVNRHQGLCADCHENLPDAAMPEDASDFLDAHPDFKVSLLLPTQSASGDIEWTLEHRLLSTAQGSDQSNLRFNHAVHLKESGIVTPAGRRVIECAECHTLEPGGARMSPISMDDHCSGCHLLNFDPDDPTREVPHGDAAGVVQALVEYYSARLLGADPDAVEQRVRRPGRALSRADRDRAAAEARGQALKVAEDLFERRSCSNCHEVTRLGDEAAIPWHVLPVRLTESFFPHAIFSHAAHDTEVSTCNSCHNASSSDSAQDVLIPDIASCRDCHGSSFASRNNSTQIPSSCVMCHGFHSELKGSYQ